jgi:tetratricopeptide (TPR) repeat protein
LTTAFLLGFSLLLGWTASGIAQTASDVDTEYRQLLVEDDRFLEHMEKLSGSRSRLTQSMLHAKARRVEAGYRKFLSEYPGHVRAMVAYGSFLRDFQRDDEALGWWNKATAVDPNCAAAFNDIAELYGSTGRAAEALRLHQKAYELAPTEPVYRFNWANTCILYRKDAQKVYGWDTDEIFRRSLEQMRKARDLAPENFEFARGYAESFFLMKNPDWQQMYAAWQYCLGQPLQAADLQLVYGHLARVSMHLKRFDEARSWLAKMDAPDVQTVRTTLERNLLELGGSAKSPPYP